MLEIRKNGKDLGQKLFLAAQDPRKKKDPVGESVPRETADDRFASQNEKFRIFPHGVGYGLKGCKSPLYLRKSLD